MLEIVCTMDLLGLMKDIHVSWNDPLAFGVPFLKRLRDTLSYIDGHHDTIAEKAPKMSVLFAKFTGYNCPESHKHRKRSKENLSRSELCILTLALQDNLQISSFKKDSYKVLREAIEKLTSSLSVYASYLQEKNRYQKLHHEMNHPCSCYS